MRQLRSILLLGGAGFLGSSLARHLLKLEGVARLVVLDKLTATGNRGNLIGPDQDPRFLFVEGDLGDQELVARLLHDNGISSVFNLACESRDDGSRNARDVQLSGNVASVMALLEVCRSSAATLLQCSTDAVYGSVDPPDRFIDASQLAPSSSFAACKAAADLICHAAVKTFEQDVVITRSSNNYGARQHADKFVPTLVKAAYHDNPLPVCGDGMNIRDWIHVDDHCRGLIAAYHKGTSGGVYLFGGACERTNLGMARSVLEVFTKPESLITSVNDRPGHDRRRSIDNAKSFAALGWRPQHRFQSVFPSVVRELAANLHSAPV